ncbi:MAG: 5'-nucleotidase [Duodenibacillus sp.]|nr:5'-nucleotidase [Duodenibacillus sp.]
MDKDLKLVIAVSSRALFDLEQEHALFEREGVAAFRAHQIAHAQEPLPPGVAFPFVRRFLKLNERFPESRPFEVAVLSRNSPETGERFFASCDHYGLSIRSGVFTSGHPAFPYMKAFGASLMLSASRKDVAAAIASGLPAGLVLPQSLPAEGEAEADDDDAELRVAFDFDGVIAGDESERAYQAGGFEQFQQHEAENANRPMQPGPLTELFQKLSAFQSLEAEKSQADRSYHPAIRASRTCIVTSRGAPNQRRIVRTLQALQSLGMSAAELVLLDGSPKHHILDQLKPHIFFDDQLQNLQNTRAPAVLVPFGIHSLYKNG